MAQTILFSRANRRQVYTIELIAALLCNVHPDIQKGTNGTAKINNNLVDVYKEICPNFPKFPFELKHAQRFKTIKIKLRDFIKDAFQDGISLDLLNAIILLTERAYEGSLKTKNIKLQESWDIINIGLFEFYEHIDPEFKETKWMKLGNTMSQKIEKIIEA